MKTYSRRIDKLEEVSQPAQQGGIELWQEDEGGLFGCDRHPELGLTREQLSTHAAGLKGRQVVAIYVHTAPEGALVALPQNYRDKWGKELQDALQARAEGR